MVLFITNHVEDDSQSIITGITHVKDRVQITVTDNNSESYVELFDIIADKGISIDLINVFPKQQNIYYSIK